LEPPINAGRTLGLRAVGCCPWQRNTRGRGQSYDYEPTDWRAGCGRPACPVRREGERVTPLSLPLSSYGRAALPSRRDFRLVTRAAMFTAPAGPSRWPSQAGSAGRQGRTGLQPVWARGKRSRLSGQARRRAGHLSLGIDTGFADTSPKTGCKPVLRGQAAARLVGVQSAARTSNHFGPDRGCVADQPQRADKAKRPRFWGGAAAGLTDTAAIHSANRHHPGPHY
jgi:hypothetical protein